MLVYKVLFTQRISDFHKDFSKHMKSFGVILLAFMMMSERKKAFNKIPN